MTNGDGWTSRKLIICMLSFFMTTALLWFGKVGEATWSMVASGSVISYLAANVMEKRGAKPPAA